MTSAFFEKAIPKSENPQRVEVQTSWREKDARLDRRERALARAKARLAKGDPTW